MAKLNRLSTLLLAVVTGMTSITAQPTIYAYRSWQQQLPISYVAGPVKFDAKTPGTVTLLDNQTQLGDINAGAYYNYKWYAQVTKPGTQSQLEGLYTLNMETGVRTLISRKGLQLAEMSYDYSTNTMYGVKNGNEYLVTINLETGEVKQIDSFADDNWYSKVILAMAINREGQMYGVGMDNMFYSIDKATATCTLIGDTGVEAAYTQDMEFDHNTGILYWCNNGDHTFYTIDVATGKATKVGEMGEHADVLTAMAVPYVNVAKGAPDRVLGRKIGLFMNTKNTIELKWILPEVDAQGEKLTALKGVKIFRNDSLIYTDDFGINAEKMPGLMQNYYDKDLKDGLYEYKIVPFNAAGDGGVDTDPLKMYIGTNAPGAVSDLTVVPGDGKATLTWKAPTAGLYGGEFDPASVTKYIVKRIASDEEKQFETTATTYEDNVNFGTVSYQVIAVNAVGEGAVAETEPVLVKPNDWIVMGQKKAVIETGKEYMFYDPAGPNAYYRNSYLDSLVMVPANPKAVVKVQFTEFSTDDYDPLTIYHGQGANAVKMGKYSGTTMASDLVEFESLANDGSLTFKFESDVVSRDEGWTAKVTAYEKKDFDLDMKMLTGNGFPTAEEKVTYTVSLMNKGVQEMKAADYKVVLKNLAGTVVAEVQGVDVAPVAVVELTMEAVFNVVGKDSLIAEIVSTKDQNAENNTSNLLNIEVLEKGSKFVVINAPKEIEKELAVVPASYMSVESISETIFEATDINAAGMELKMVQYPFSKVETNYADVPMKLYVTETELDTLVEKTFLPSEMTLVFDGNVPVSTTDKYLTIAFDKPYKYTGKNLVVMLYKNAPQAVNSGIAFKGTYSGNKRRTRFVNTWGDEVLDLTFPDGIGWGAAAMIPNIEMLFGKAESGVENAMADNDVKVYPNPATEVVFFSETMAKAELVSVAGQVVMTAENVKEMNVEALPAGVYMLNAEKADGTVVRTKVVKK